MISVQLWQLSVSSAVVLILPRRCQRSCCDSFFSSVSPRISFRPSWAATWLQQNAQCHVLAQVLRCVVMLLQVSHVCYSSFFLNFILLSSGHHYKREHLRIVHVLAWRHMQPSILFLLPASLSYPAHWSHLVMRGAVRLHMVHMIYLLILLHRSSSPGTDLQRGGERGWTPIQNINWAQYGQYWIQSVWSKSIFIISVTFVSVLYCT